MHCPTRSSRETRDGYRPNPSCSTPPSRTLLQVHPLLAFNTAFFSALARCVSAAELRRKMREVLNGVEVTGVPVQIERRGKVAGVLVSREDFELYQSWVDQGDVRAAREAMNEPGESIPLDEMRKRLGL